MKRIGLLKFSCLLAVLLLPGLCPGEEYLLYTPTSVDGKQVPPSPDKGILVKSITVNKGDTLSTIAKKHIGKGGWYSQILLFNSIDNPNLIYAGNKLLVPVPPEGKQARPEKKSTHRKKSGTVAKQPVKHHVEGKRSQTEPAANDGQHIFQKARKAYLKGEYRQAARSFDKFLQEFPNSPLAADATLYRADCYLHLAGN